MRPNSVAHRVGDYIRTAYDESYRILEDCPEDEGVNICLGRVEKRLGAPNANVTAPWWFRTLVRDSSRRGHALHGTWHELMSLEPLLRMCVIEKIGIKHWRQVFCELNTGDSECPPSKSNYPKQKISPPRAVFLRDPLERFLSGYLDKCESSHRAEGHCEPAEIFLAPSPPNNTPDVRLTAGLNVDPRARFAAYVDAMPLRWNLHFFPQSLYCGGLSRTLGSYDFVGIMNENFYGELDAFGTKFGKKLTQALENTFSVRSKLNMTNYGLETSAPAHVSDYYSGQTVMRVLRYTSIDYITLNLTVPKWALDMLEQEGW
eukprot:CAMPEP_0113525950 /NCGR_PEP_ID=MMETSP0015_2-20120614/468_1 /TAXON_ID=2838 /ORGANISM="Odontella" /LENGTH=316 /DNA_ID=CAMNT_0000424217 /DNA_START=228 /DNA_END=1178 /DNA_ORIENTATION=+ /assembly_acc=CAM_ASM_000160